MPEERARSNQPQLGGNMFRRYLITVLLVIFLVGCSNPIPEQTVQDPNVTPEGIRITPDVVYGHKFGLALTFDMYQPKNKNGAGVIYIDSGGWESPYSNLYVQTAEGIHLLNDNELERENPIMRSMSINPLLAKGFTVFTVRHGSRPKFELYEIVNDIRDATRFIRHHSKDFGIDSERLGIWGGSAGGHLSLLIATTAEIVNAEADKAIGKISGHLAAAVAYAPPTDLKELSDYIRKDNPNVLKQSGLDIADDKLKELSPITYVSSDDPPTLIIHGAKDPVVPLNHGKSMYLTLKAAGVESKLITVPDAEHGFFNKDADLATSEMIGWFEEHLVEK
jgi:acetyl esterase/lipase